MRKPTPVTTSSITAESWSTCAVTAVLKVPATIHGKSSPVQVSPCQTRAKTAHEVRNEAPSAGTATQCARWPIARPKSALTRAPTSGSAGISQTRRDMVVLLGANPHHSSERARSVKGGRGPMCVAILRCACRQRSTYAEYAARRRLPRASSGSHLDPRPGPLAYGVTWSARFPEGGLISWARGALEGPALARSARHSARPLRGRVAYLAWRQTLPGVPAVLVAAPQFIGVGTPLTVELRAPRGGVESVDVRLDPGRHAVVLAQQAFSGRGRQRAARGPHRGRAARSGCARARRPSRCGRATASGGRSAWTTAMIASLPVTLDFTPPTLEVLAATRYLSRAAAGWSRLRAKGARAVGGQRRAISSSPASRRARRTPGSHAALYALPWDLRPTRRSPSLAQDEAGNAVSRALAGASIRPRKFPIGHHRAERAVPRQQDARAPARARRRSRPTSSSRRSSS